MSNLESSQEWAVNFGELAFSMDRLLEKASRRGIVSVKVRSKSIDPLFPRVEIEDENGRVLVLVIPSGDEEGLRCWLAGWLAGFDEANQIK